jgi:hypothetical protein
MRVTSFAFAAAIVGILVSSPTTAQRTTGVPGSPSAPTTIDGARAAHRTSGR